MIREGMKCVHCGRIAKPAVLSFQGYKIDGWECRCGEKYYHPAQAERILTLNKLRHEALEAKLGRIKSNLILRIPKAVEAALDLREGETMKLRVKGTRELNVVPA